jgi:hypothetical protein
VTGTVFGHRAVDLTSAARRASRDQWVANRIARLSDVNVRPVREAVGRVITVAVRKPTNTTPDIAADALQQYIRPWWTTVNRIGLRGTVLVSGWPDECVRAVHTPLVDTVAVSPGPRHIFFERHRLVREFLSGCSDPLVFVTDGSDVAFKSDPFELVREAGSKRKLFIGSETHRILFCRCVRREMWRQFGKLWFPLRPVLNPGILGGRREVVIEALDRICEVIDSLGTGVTATDMSSVNRAIHAAFTPDELVTGQPLHSRFKGWEYESAAAILHK